MLANKQTTHRPIDAPISPIPDKTMNQPNNHMGAHTAPHAMPHANITDGPANSFDAALTRVAALQALDSEPALNPVCAARIYHHGARTQRVVVCFHGYTNCPAQFEQLGQRFYAAGSNVLIPRLPHHGMQDRMSRANQRLRAADMRQTTQTAIDIARGLGEEVVIVGLSAGGVMSAWAAQFRPDVATALVIAPSLGFPGWPAWLSDVTASLLRRLPNLYIWWDRKAKQHARGAAHAYPRFSTRSLAEVFAFGREVRRTARRQPPLAQRIVVVGSPADRAVHHPLTDLLVEAWSRHVPGRVYPYMFPADWKLIHDMIDPTQPRQQIDKVYPILMQLIQPSPRS